MHTAFKTFLSLSVAIAAAGCASPIAPQPGAPTAPPGHLAHPAAPHDATHIDPETGEVMEGELHEPDAAGEPEDLAPHMPVEHGAGGGAAHGAGDGDAEPAAVTLDTPAVKFRTEVVPILRQHCASCHTAGGAGAAALTMFDEQGEPQHAAIQRQIGRMLLEIQSGRMPKGKPDSLSEDEFNTLDRWGAAEAPDN